MSMTQEEKERLAGRVVAVLRDDDPWARIAELRAKVEAGDEGDDGMNGAVVAIAQAVLEQRDRERGPDG